MKLLIFAFLLIVYMGAHAQKLPNVQQVSLRAPANVKIDGKATEWGKKLQAYNPATEVFYTMANDDKKLYLIVQVSQSVMTTAVNGGIKLAIQKAGYKSDAGAPFIKFPYMEKGKTVLIDPKDWDHATDTAVIKYNKQLATRAKWIYTSGLNGVDSLLSIYNEHGVAAANAFDNEMKYTLEMAIDLSLLGLSFDHASKFSYHLMINAEPNSYSFTGPLNVMKRVVSNNNWPTTERSIQNMETFENFLNNWTAPTDFWGEYALAK
ncbi:hypothetical protein [Mucilaginibacter sp. HD30]